MWNLCDIYWMCTVSHPPPPHNSYTLNPPPPPCTLWPTYCKIHYTIPKILQLVQLEQWRPGCKSTVGSLMFLCINYWGLRKIHRFEDVNLWTIWSYKYYLHSISYFIAELWFKSWINSKKKFNKINHKIGTKNVAITDLALGTCESLQTDRFHIHCTTVLTI